MKASWSLRGQAPPINVTVEPSPCVLPFSAEADGLHYLWRGLGPDEKSSFLSVYECNSEQWNVKPTTKPPHPALCSGCSVCVGRHLYIFGGYGSTYFNVTSKLDLDTLQWSKVQTAGCQPIRKDGCGLVRVDDRTLCCIGGYGTCVGPTAPGSTFNIDSDCSDELGWTNEIHMFDIQNGNWSMPQFGGERPPPCSFFTFTKVDQYRAVMFGGNVAGYRTVNTVYLTDFRSMTTTKVEAAEGEPWPMERSFHAACCINYGGDHPQLLVCGGRDNGRNILRDMWVFDVETGKWTEVTPLESITIKPRWGHSLTATSLGTGLTEVLLFGGRQMFWGSPIAETTILRFGLISNCVRALEEQLQTPEPKEKH